MATTRLSPVLALGRDLGRRWCALAGIVRVGVVATGCGLLVGVVTTLFLVQEREELRLTSAPLASDGSVHLGLEGEPVLLKAVLSPRPGHRLTVRWAFGDESDPVEGIVTNPFGVSAVHAYAESAPGTVYQARLTVTDEATGLTATTTYPVRFVEATTENKRSVVLDDALWALHASMTRAEDYVHGPVGHWGSGDYPFSTTAMAVMSFEVNGFDARDEREGNPYQDTVERGLAYLLNGLETAEIKEQPAGQPDSNGNGLGITVRASDRPGYEVPLAVMALVASQAPDRIATTGSEGIVGRCYRDLVIDMLDFLAFAQVDGHGKNQGGWRYRANERRADMSVTQWPVLAFLSAAEVWDIPAPDWVKQELRENFLKHSQTAGGGFSYKPGERQNVGLTGAGLIALAFTDVSADDERVTRATAYIEANWKRANLGNFYNMYAVMKGARLTRTPIATFGEHDWLTEYVEQLHSTQQDLGHWKQGGRWASGARLTAWPALIISKDVFATSRPATIAWIWILSLTTLVIGIAVVCIRRFWFPRGPHRA